MYLSGHYIQQRKLNCHGQKKTKNVDYVKLKKLKKNIFSAELKETLVIFVELTPIGTLVQN
jgi:hypothetical protein